MPTIETVTGPVDSDSVGLTLPHEHVFVDLSGPDDPGFCQVDWPKIRETCTHTVAGLRQLDVDLLVDCTALGIGRNASLLRDVSLATGVRIVCATGIYKGLVPGELREAGHGDRVIVSTDTSMWVNPPELAYDRSIEHLLGVFLPHLEARLGTDTRRRLTHENPARAIARPTGG